MAIIKCPECGHTVSDKAPICPKCGVEIVNKIIICPKCGNKYLKTQTECPQCHNLTTCIDMADPHNVSAPQQPQQPNNINYTYIIIATIIGIIILSACLFFFVFKSNSSNSEELTEYEYALNSNDIDILQKYLETYDNAPEEHRKTITTHLNELQEMYRAWTNAVVNGSKTSIEDFLKNYPNSQYKKEALHKIDSIDWVYASSSNTIEAYETYMQNQPNGEYFDKADECIRNLKTQTIQPEEEIMISILFRTFFQSINNRNETMLSETLNQILTSFLGKQDATQADVITFMNKIYKNTVSQMDWHTDDNYNIQKKEIGNQKYEYSVEFNAIQDIENTDATTIRNNYRINAKVNPEGKITEFNMTKIIKQ